MTKFALSSLLAGSVAVAQAPFANLFWEANDGGGWTRNALTTTNRTVQVRLVAEWGAVDGYGFSVTGFDAVIGSADTTDNATRLTRFVPFDLVTSEMAAMRQGNLIKLDVATDVAAPGAGTGWIFASQGSGHFGGVIDPANPAHLFGFDLELGDVAGTRRVSSVHHVRFGGNAGIYIGPTSQVFVIAPVAGVDITYVPTAPSVAVVVAGLVATRRQRRSISSLQSTK